MANKIDDYLSNISLILWPKKCIKKPNITSKSASMTLQIKNRLINLTTELFFKKIKK